MGQAKRNEAAGVKYHSTSWFRANKIKETGLWARKSSFFIDNENDKKYVWCYGAFSQAREHGRDYLDQTPLQSTEEVGEEPTLNGQYAIIEFALVGSYEPDVELVFWDVDVECTAQRIASDIPQQNIKRIHYFEHDKLIRVEEVNI
jgi:hypothetical protein